MYSSRIKTRLFWNQYMHNILLTMLLFIKLFSYTERVLNLFMKYCKCSIYAYVSNLKILTSKVMDGHLLEWSDELSYSGWIN